MTKKKETKTKEKKYRVKCFDDYKKHIKDGLRLNPMEKVMAINLLSIGYPFTMQTRLDIPICWQLDGRKYFILDFVVDFGNDKKLVIETDGKIHDSNEQIEKDRYRDNIICSLGIGVMRFSWDEVMGNDNCLDIADLISCYADVDEFFSF